LDWRKLCTENGHGRAVFQAEHHVSIWPQHQADGTPESEAEVDQTPDVEIERLVRLPANHNALLIIFLPYPLLALKGRQSGVAE
jgi:hypothetical protein